MESDWPENDSFLKEKLVRSCNFYLKKKLASNKMNSNQKNIKSMTVGTVESGNMANLLEKGFSILKEISKARITREISKDNLTGKEK